MTTRTDPMSAFAHYQTYREWCSIPRHKCTRGSLGEPARAVAVVIATGDYCDGELFGACQYHLEVIHSRHGFLQCDHGWVRQRAQFDI